LEEIGVQEYFLVKIGRPVAGTGNPNKKPGKATEDSEWLISKYQFLKCYKCGDKKEGEMTICKNT
jgi:hypothetical protein